MWQALLCGALGLASVAPARADEGADALASRTAFDEARRLMAAGQHAEACAKFEQSQKLRSGIGTQFNLAECYEKTGRVASAWSLYLRVASETASLGQVEREEVALGRAAALEKRLTRLVISVAEPLDDLEIEVDGAAIPRESWATGAPLDPGMRAVVARAPGHETWRGVAVVSETAAEVAIIVPALRRSVQAARPNEPEARRQVSAAPIEDSRSVLAQRMPYIVGGVGVAGVVLGGLFGLRAMSQNDKAKEICVAAPTACPGDQIERHEEFTAAARSARGAAYLTFGLGLVGIGVSAAWLLSDGDTEAEGSGAKAAATSARRVVLQTHLDAGELGAALEYAF